MAIKIKREQKELILASSYMDITKSAPPPEHHPLVNYADQQKLPLIIGSDTNGHHTLWGNKECNSRGEELLDFLSSFGLSWANKGAKPTFMNSRGQNSIIDLTITNNKSVDLISNWHVSDKFSNSDHCYIMFDITSKTNSEPKKIRLTKNTDWDIFDECLKSDNRLEALRSAELETPEQIDKATNDINSAMREAFELACPITYISSTIKKPPWLTPEVEKAQRGIRHKLMLARNGKTQEAWDSLRESNRLYNKILKKTQQKAWRTFCQDTESVKESARMSKIIKSFPNKQEKLEAVYKAPNTLTTDAEETLEVMTKTHFKDDSTYQQDLEITPTITPPAELMEQIYDPDRINRAVNSFDPDKAAGPDTLKPIIIQKAWSTIKDITRMIMIQNHKIQHIPVPWRESLGIFIPKPGKADYNDPKAYRNITLSPVMLKLQEKTILWHMQHDLGMADSLNKKQFGFRRGNSTETALHKVVHQIERRIAKKGYVLGTFLDIEGAFDNVSFNAISKAINSSPVDKSTARWIINMVTNRFITLNHKHITKRIRIRRGCPQGGILSPFLWNLIVDDLLRFTAKEIPGYLQAFADDLSALAEGNDTEVIWSRTCRTINTIEKWCETKGLRISAMKTKIIMFTRNRKWSLRPIRVGGNTIELSPTVKLLGVTLDNKLNFNEHINKITKKATNSLMQCKRAVGPTWGLTPRTCKWIYSAVIRPILTYCAVIWIRALKTKLNSTKVRRVQALALRIMSGAFPSTPFNSLNHVTDFPDIIIFLEGEAAKGAARLQGYGDWTGETAPTGKGIIEAHSTINNKFLMEADIPKTAPRDLMKPVMTLDRKYTIHLPDDNDTYRQTLFTIIPDQPAEAISGYTDGSKTEDGTGGGFIITNNNNTHTIAESSFKLPDYCSVYQAELIAITEAAKSLNNHREETITFWSDSLSSLQAISSTIIKSKTAYQCHEALSELAVHNTVSVKWIAAHSGHWGNEKADALAKAGTQSTNYINGPLPQSYIKAKINNRVKALIMRPGTKMVIDTQTLPWEAIMITSRSYSTTHS
ncbi:MAG: hypothetical protein GY820_18040 [Gammaproteobacteria bacterium]|nr:hypothetical protein [Gammaproteobacteria bacterium]